MTRDEIVEVLARALFDRDHNGPFAHKGVTHVIFGCAQITYDEVRKGIAAGVYTESVLSACRAEASAALTALEVKGLVVVPREPTDGMLHDGSSAYDYPSVYMGGPSEGGKRLSARIYRAMLAAALPESPTERGKDDE